MSKNTQDKYKWKEAILNQGLRHQKNKEGYFIVTKGNFYSEDKIDSSQRRNLKIT